MSRPSHVLLQLEPMMPGWQRPLRTAVLLGGDSAEREISLQSGQAVLAALAGRGHQVVPLDPRAVDLRSVNWDAFDVAFLALHGTCGEDGQVQAILEECGVAYTGSGPVASRTAFHKWEAKLAFAKHGVRTPRALRLHTPGGPAADLHGDDLASILSRAGLGFPLVAKPDAQGSSLGVALVQNLEELRQALTACRPFGDAALIEQAIPGVEWTVPLLGTRTLPPIRIGSPRIVFDFAAKYEEDTLLEVAPPASRAMRALILDAARQAYVAVGAAGLARVDLRIDNEGLPSVLEINTIPGLTSHSLTPQSAAWVGIDLGRLCELCLSDALMRHRDRRKLRVA